MEEMFKGRDLEKELEIKFNEILGKIKKISPYQLLHNAINLYKQNQLLFQNIEEITEDSVVDMKFNYEFLQLLYTTIKEEELKIEDYNDATFFEIIKLVDDIHVLLQKIMLKETLSKDDKISPEEREYIYDDFNRLIITGKRYDVFEDIHHKDILSPLKDFFQEQYNFEIDEVYEGIHKIKYQFVFGLDKVTKEMGDLIDVQSERVLSEEEMIKAAEKTYQIFGLELYNVNKICNWPEKFIDIFSLKLGDNSDILSDISFNNIIGLYSQINRKPIIKLQENYYCLNPQRLCDNIDRIIMKDLFKKASSKKQKIIKLISDNCEELTANMFKKIMPNALIDLKNYYKIDTGYAENDLLIEYDNNLIVVEIKSGSFTPDVAYNNIDSHIDSLKNLLEKSDTQSYNFVETLKNNGRLTIYEDNRQNSKIKRTLKYADYNKIYRITVTLEAFNEIESRAEKINILNLNKDIIVICLDDLRVYSDYFENNLSEFFHYLNQRVKATRNKKLYLNDELDHLGLYIDYNDYILTLNNEVKKEKNVGTIIFEEPRKYIDEYYNSKFFYGLNVTKPKQNFPKHINDIINFCNNNYIANSTILTNSILSLSRESKENEINKNIELLINSNIVQNRYKIFYAGTDIFFFFICLKKDDKIDIKQFELKIYSNIYLSKKDKSYGVFIYYDKTLQISNILINIYDLSSVDNLDEIIAYSEEVKKSRVELQTKKIKIGRNDPCPCGSGKKFKYCCLNNNSN